MLRDLLNIEDGIVIRKIVETSDGSGGTTTTTTLTTLSRGNIWAAGSNAIPVSDKITNFSTHTLALEYGAYTFSDSDREVTYAGNTYEIAGHPDDVGSRGVLVLVPLKWLS